jgi:hypothetical protein
LDRIVVFLSIFEEIIAQNPKSHDARLWVAGEWWGRPI